MLPSVPCPPGEESRFSWDEGYPSKVEMEEDMNKGGEGTDKWLK